MADPAEKPDKPEIPKKPVEAEKPINSLVEVVLLCGHEHGGIKKNKGDKISVSPRQVAFLRKNGVIA